MPEPLATAISDHLADIISESRGLRSDVRAAEAARRRATRFNLAVLAVLALALVAVGVLGWQNYRTGQQVAETNARMADCTTPGGRCYEEGRKRTATAINDVLKVSIYMAECARLYPGESGPDYDRKLEACVYERLAAPSPAPSSR